MSTPSTLVQTVPHQHLDHHRYLPSPQDRFLPPPRPSSNGYHHNPLPSIPARPSSNLSRQLPPPPPESSGMSASYSHNHNQNHRHSHSQSHAGSEYSYPHHTHDELRRTDSRSSQQHSRQLPPPPMLQHHQQQQQQQQHHLQASSPSRALPAVPTDAMPPAQYNDLDRHGSSERGRKRRQKSPVDWVAFFGGKPPTEIIEIHDDDSPAPPATIQRLPPPATNGASHSHHVDKKRRVNGGSGDAHGYSTTNTPYSYTNGTSADSLQATTAPTSLGSQASTAGRVDNTQTAGQKRKRTTRTTDAALKKEEAERAGPQGYLAEYGEYHPPTKLSKKQKDVVVPAIHDRHKPSDKIDDEDGHYIVHENSRLGEKYNLLNLLGQGTFGKVVRAIDIRNRKEVAVKIIRAVPKYRDASRIELRVLKTLREADEHNRNRCIQLRDCFDWRGHICIVTPLLGLSVFDFLKGGGFVPFPSSHIQAFARQLLGSIAFLHDLNLIHTDLKPENILLLNHAYQTFTYNRNIPSSSTLTSRSAKFRRVLLSPQINLIDFGSATFDDEYHSSVVSTRHYRAPEIILGIGWSHPIDLWSLGCILVECWTGDALFQTHDCAEHLSMMEAVTGNPIDRAIIREVNRVGKRNDRTSAARFFKGGQLQYPMPDTPRQSRKFVRGMKRLDEIIPQNNAFNKLFLDLLRRIFVYDPKKRITAREALKHPWFSELVEDDGTEATRIRLERERTADQAERGGAR
ncbi:related to LAMMER kinase-like protein [Ramularia collo-cygni]|uniref:Related to LAMMER kinase-like protein n=1 Tax=Ramularia collo-cygni TaxID=112498 RepID=A0A2D3VME3_9PEZI|nr:related to LAMMER kinase-like protein [Ramularia collo-cygni]CZT23914.1 related to LAMMER kinase-like protein [Ramularia collo-cygni]